MDDILSIFYDPVAALDPLTALKQAISSNDDKIMDLNRRQLDKGLDATGKSLGRYKNFNYKNRFQPVDLKLKNEFRGKFTLQISDKETEIFSQDRKEKWLVKRYGLNIFGVPVPMIDTMQDIIREDFINNYRNQFK